MKRPSAADSFSAEDAQTPVGTHAAPIVSVNVTARRRSWRRWLALPLIFGAALIIPIPEPQPAWVAVDRQHWDAALAQFNRTYASAAKMSAKRTNDAAALALAQSIAYSRRSALAADARPIPPAIREALKGHFPDDVLDDVRWTLAGQRVDLGSALARWAINEGAVTMDDVVVFSREKGARSIALWAHELTHVVQYRELGVRNFARLYTTNWRLLEQRARTNAGEILRSIKQDIAAERANEPAQAG